MAKKRRTVVTLKAIQRKGFKFRKSERESALGKKRKELPSSYFLLPKERKFPYKTASGKISESMLVHAKARAGQHGYPQVAKKAEKLLIRHFGYKKVNGLKKVKK